MKGLELFTRKTEGARYLCALLVIAVLMALLFSTGHIIYQTNDDSTIVSAAAGSLTGENEPDNALTGYLYGWLLAAVYRLAPALPWHALILLFLQAAALICVLKTAFKLCDRRGVSRLIGLGAFLALTLSVYAAFFYELQFTAAPAILATGAYALLLGSRPDDKKGWKVGEIILALLMAAFGFLIRKDAFLLTLPAFLMPAILLFLQEKPRRRALLIRSGALAALTALLFVSDAPLYRMNSEGWDEYQQFEEQTTQLMDFGSADALIRAGEKGGWTTELSQMVSEWFFLDERINVETLPPILAAMDADQPSPTVMSVLRATGSVLKAYPVYQLNFIALALVCALLLCRYIKQKKGWLSLLPLGLLGYAVVTIAYFYGVLGRFPTRVAFAAICPVYAAAMLLALETPIKLCFQKATAAACAVMLALCAGYGVSQLDISTAPTSGAAMTSRINQYVRQTPDMTYVTNIAQEYDPLASVERGASQNLIFWGHGLTGAPVLQKQQRVNGYAPLTSRNFGDDKVRILVTDEGAMDKLASYLLELFPVVATEQIDRGEGFLVYRVLP